MGEREYLMDYFGEETANQIGMDIPQNGARRPHADER